MRRNGFREGIVFLVLIKVSKCICEGLVRINVLHSMVPAAPVHFSSLSLSLVRGHLILSA